ncbi:MAG: thioredoxin [Pelagibacterales bacterium]|nr:thioredoxin [Pelagibacterales bacterium]
MMIKILHILLLVLFMSYNGHAQEGFSKEDIEDIIYEYIMENPEIILESVDNLRKKMEASSIESDNFLKDEFDTFANDNNIPNFGDPNAKVIIIEFVDYNCGYCKKSLDAITRLLNSELSLKISFRDYPILSASSKFAAKAALAAKKQGKYFELHSELLNVKGNLSEEKILEIAKNIDIDVAKLKIDMEDPEIAVIIQNNENLAKKLNIRGTPTFIINGKLYAGALEFDKLRALIDKALSEI